MTEFSALFRKMKPFYDVVAYFVPVDPNKIVALANRDGIKVVHHGGPMNYARFYYPELLPSFIDKVIQVDTDTIFGASIYQLWKRFDSFGPETLFAARPVIPIHDTSRKDNLSVDYLKNTTFEGTDARVCGCLMLMDLNKMRKEGWKAGSSFIYEFISPISKGSLCGTGGEQLLFSSFAAMAPSRVQLIPSDWMYDYCSNYKGFNPQKSWGIAHFSCDGNADFFGRKRSHSQFAGEFYAAIDTFNEWSKDN